MLHCSSDQSKWSAPSFSSTTFQNFPDVSDIHSEASNFQHNKMLCYKRSVSLVSPLKVCPVCWWYESSSCWKLLFFFMATFHLISSAHFASSVTTLIKCFKYFTFCSCLLAIVVLRFSLPEFFFHIQNTPYLLMRRVDTSFLIRGKNKNKMHLK